MKDTEFFSINSNFLLISYEFLKKYSFLGIYKKFIIMEIFMETQIKSLGKDIDKYLVQKSKPLFSLWQSELTLAEFKILDVYLGRINSHNDEHRTVRFKKGELEQLLGIKQLKSKDLDDRLKHLMTTVRIKDNTNKNGFTRIALFEKAYAEQNDYGLWEVELTCTESAKQYIFNLEEINYLRYKLRNIVNIKSRYAYIMFLYIFENKYHKVWEISLDELKKMLNCESEETYKQFKRFNDLVLKKIHKEINDVTDILYDYETVKDGHFVIAIRIIYKGMKKNLGDAGENQIIEELPQEILESEQRKDLWQRSLAEFNLTKGQLDVIRSFLVTLPDYKLPESPACYGDIELRQYHYIEQKVKEIKVRDNIKNPYNYLVQIIKNDVYSE